MNKERIKELVMSLISFAVGYVSDVVDGKINYVYILIVWLSMTLGYIGKNAKFKSISVFGSIDLKDFYSGLFMSLSASIGVFAGVMLTDVKFTIAGLLAAMFSGFTGYLTTKFASNSKGQLLKKEN